MIYKYALDHLAKDACQEIYKNYTVHEKKFGDRRGIEDVIVSKRKFMYEEVCSVLLAFLKINFIKSFNSILIEQFLCCKNVKGFVHACRIGPLNIILYECLFDLL